MSADKLFLQGRRVWVTRPVGQAENLIELIQMAGGEAIHFPVLEIHETENPEYEVNKLQKLSDYYAVIFISRNAVTHAFRLFPDLSEKINDLLVLAVGAGTRAELSAHGVAKVITAFNGSGSEAIVQLSALQTENVCDKKIMIVRGQGGRELLRDSLTNRGCHVDYAEAYRRTLPIIAPEQAKKVWQEKKPDVIVVTSIEGLHNLIKLVHADNHEALLDTPVAVISKRTQEEARTLGFSIASHTEDNASDEGLLRAVGQSFEVKQK